jgi:putative cell wall-binding protein
MDNINLDPQQIQQMILLLQTMLPKPSADNNQETSFEVVKTPKVSKSKKPIESTSSSKFVRPNKFEDMPEIKMHKEDIALDKKLSVLPPVPRARKFSKVSAICRVCGKKEEVNPALITDSIDRYKCNKCSAGAG